MEAGSGADLLPCRNCGAVPPAQTPPPHYCAQCGQERTLHPPTLAEFLHEFIGHYVALEGPLWRSLGLLLARPGRLTREYLAGRRRRYVLPLRLYLSASFLFFVVLKLIPSAVDEVTTIQDRTSPQAATGAASGAAGAASEAAMTFRIGERAASAASQAGMTWHFGEIPPTAMIGNCDTPGHPACTRVKRWIKGLLERARQDPKAFIEHVRAHAFAIAPYAVFLLLPLFAALVMLAYRSRRMTYGEHVVFSLHLHALWFVALLAAALLPSGASDLVLFAIPVYGVMALRTVYAGGWLATIARATLVSLAYGVALFAATAGLLFVLLSTA